jgi:hypothetical protein
MFWISSTATYLPYLLLCRPCSNDHVVSSTVIFAIAVSDFATCLCHYLSQHMKAQAVAPNLLRILSGYSKPSHLLNLVIPPPSPAPLALSFKSVHTIKLSVYSIPSGQESWRRGDSEGLAVSYTPGAAPMKLLPPQPQILGMDPHFGG